MIPGLNAKREQMQQMMELANNPAESPQVEALVTIIAELEYRQLEAVENLHSALDVDGLEVTGDREQRQEQLKELIEAIASGDVTEHWFANVASEHIENPEKATAYADLSEDEWEDQIEQWADAYRSRIPDAEDMTDRELAAEHIYRTFGVGIDEFEREVVSFSEGEALQTLLARNFEAVEEGIQTAADVAADAEVAR